MEFCALDDKGLTERFISPWNIIIYKIQNLKDKTKYSIETINI